MTVSKELSKYMLDLARLQEVRRDRGGTEPACQCTFLYVNGNENRELNKGLFVHKIIISVVMTADC
jgi:hypothetical protein